MWMKILGILCVCSATAGYGYWKSIEYQKHLKELEYLKHVIWLLKGELSYTKASLSEICHKLHRKTLAPYDAWFFRLAKRQEERDSQSLGELWEAETRQILGTLILSKEEFQELALLGYQIGLQDSKMQTQVLEWFLEQIEERRKRLSEKMSEKRKLTQTLGVASGILLCILLI